MSGTQGIPGLFGTARTTPERTALIFGDRTVSFGALAGRIFQLVRALRTAGLQQGESVALVARNCIEFVEVMFATEYGGFRLTPINPALSEREARFILDDCDARVLIAQTACAGLASALTQDPDALTTRWSIGGPLPGFESYEAALAAELAEDPGESPLGTVMLYTSGTTGRPKGVRRENVSLAGLRELPLALQAMRFNPATDRALCSGSLCHGANFGPATKLPLTLGGGVVLMDGFDPLQLLALVEQHRVTHMTAVPVMFRRLLALPPEQRAQFDVRSLRFILHGAAPCEVSLKLATMEWLGPILYEYYGAVEGFGTIITPQEYLTKPGSVGRIDKAFVAVLDDQGNPVASGETGQVHLRMNRDTRFSYHKDPAKTAGSQRNDFFNTGDIGFVDTDGYLFLVDRSADVINSGGSNIYPAEIDVVLREHADIADAMTFGVPDPEWGESVYAVVTTRTAPPDPRQLEQQLIAHCRATLAHYKCPRHVEVVGEIPRDENGKPRRRLMRDAYRTRARVHA